MACDVHCSTTSNSIIQFFISWHPVQALIQQSDVQTKDTVVTENGKVIADNGSGSDNGSQFYPMPIDYFDIKHNRPLRLKRKFYEFYSAPITKFWANSVSSV